MSFLDGLKNPRSNPREFAITLAIGAAVVGAAYYFWANREDVKDDLKTAGRKIEGAGHKVADGASKVGHKAADGATKVGHTVADGASRVGHHVSDGATKVGHTVADGVKSAVNTVGGAVQRGYGQAERVIERTFNRLSDRLKPATSRVTDFKAINLERFVEVKKQAITQNHQTNALTSETVDRINELAIEISEQDFRMALKLNREQRRKLIDNDKPQYEELFIDGLKDIEIIFNENLNAILADCEISRATYDASAGKSTTHPKLEGDALFQTLLSKQPALNLTDSPTSELAADVYKHMKEQYERIMYRPINREYVTEIKRAMALDRVHDKFGLEEEDLAKLRKNFASDVQSFQDQINTLTEQDAAAARARA